MTDKKQFEKAYVHDAYEHIAKEFDETRIHVWGAVAEFLRGVQTGATILDAGCGNGKNMIYRKDLSMIGFDASESFVKLCCDKNLNVFLGDIRNIQIRNNSVDHVICVAVIGHLTTQQDRRQAIKELVRVTKKNGLIFIQCWDLSALHENKIDDKFTKMGDGKDGKDDKYDYLVSWGISKTKRFYHLFDIDEMSRLLEGYNIVSIYQEKRGIVGIIRV